MATDERFARFARYRLVALLERSGRTVDAEREWRDAIAAGDSLARVDLAELLEREGRLADAQAQWRAAAAAGDPRARSRLATLLQRGAPAEEPDATQ